MTIQPARHECHACCLLRAGFLAFQPVVDNTRGTRVEQVVSSFQKPQRLATHMVHTEICFFFQWCYIDTNSVNFHGITETLPDSNLECRLFDLSLT